MLRCETYGFYLIATVKAQASPIFWDCMFQFVEKLQILLLPELVQQYWQKTVLITNDKIVPLLDAKLQIFFENGEKG